MLFAVIFTDKLDSGAIRMAHREAHIEWLEQNRAVIPVAGLRQSYETFHWSKANAQRKVLI